MSTFIFVQILYYHPQYTGYQIGHTLLTCLFSSVQIPHISNVRFLYVQNPTCLRLCLVVVVGEVNAQMIGWKPQECHTLDFFFLF